MGENRHEHPTTSSQDREHELLDSWKEIASYLDRDVRTVIRWEKKEGLPVRRHIHGKQSTVYAYRSEIDSWLENRCPDLDKEEPARWFSSLPGNKWTVGWMTAGTVLVLLAALAGSLKPDFFSTKTAGLDFRARDWVLITDFENRTGESALDGVVESALRRGLSDSQFVNVVPRERIEDTLRLMRKTVDTPIDKALGREICLRDQRIKAFLTGWVEKLDSTYLLSVELVDPASGQSIAAASNEAAGQGQVLSAVRSLSTWSRETLGEKLTDIRESEEQLERVTTPSLRALQLFSKAEALVNTGGSSQGPAEELLRQAVAIDPEFASAHIYLAYATLNQVKPADEYMKHAERAFQLAGTTSERERYFIQGSYYWMKGERDRAMHAFEALVALYPDFFWATDTRGIQLTRVGGEQAALTDWLRNADFRPNSFDYTQRAAMQLLLHGDLATAKTYWGRALDLMTPEDIDRDPDEAIHLMWFPAFEALLHAEPETALREANRLLESLRSLERRGLLDYEVEESSRPKGISIWRGAGVRPTGAFYLTLGKIGLAREWFEETENIDTRRHYFLAAIAYVEGDHEAMTEHLNQALEAWESLRLTGSSLPQRNLMVLLARGGFLSEAEERLSRRVHARGTPNVLLEDVARNHEKMRAVFTLSRGNRIEGIRMLEEALSSFGAWDYSATLYFMGAEILAEAWREQGDSGKAVQVIKAALEKKSRLLLEQSLLTGPLWLKLQSQLAQLYRELGRDADARKIEDELRKRLALADADHPILLQLNRTEDLALREATDN
jgi:tetratricopeptide (TPR) repeat protein